MSRSARRRPPRPRAAAEPRRRRTPVRRTLVGVAAGVAALALVGLALLPRWRPGHGRGGAPAPDSLLAMAPEEAYARASALYRSEPERSVPYYLRALAAPGRELDVRLGLGNALHNAAVKTGLRRGRPAFGTRSSAERVALMRAALAELERAAALSATPEQQAIVHATRAHHYVTWGMPWDALAEMSAAARLDPGWSGLARELGLWLRDPVHHGPETALEP